MLPGRVFDDYWLGRGVSVGVRKLGCRNRCSSAQEERVADRGVTRHDSPGCVERPAGPLPLLGLGTGGGWSKAKVYQVCQVLVRYGLEGEKE